MSFTHGKNAAVLSGGYELTHYLSSASIANERDMAEASTFGTEFKRYVPGLNDSTMSMEGMYDGSEEAIDQLLYNSLQGPNALVYSYGPAGSAQGAETYSLVGFLSSYEITSDIGEVNQISAEVQADQVVQRGIVAHPMKAETAGGTGATLDNTEATHNGGYLFVHANAVDSTGGGAALTVTVQDSADGSTWADLGTVTLDATGDASLMLTGDIRQYTRVKWNQGATFAAIISRK